jgi:hypothetical protein
LLVSAIQLNLIVPAVIPIAAIAAILIIVTVNAIVTVDAIIAVPVPMASPITLVVTMAIIAMPTSSRVPVPVPAIAVLVTTVIIAIIIAIIIATLRRSGTACRSNYPKNKCERQKSPANPSSKFFHICRSLLSGEDGNLHASKAIIRDRLICRL